MKSHLPMEGRWYIPDIYSESVYGEVAHKEGQGLRLTVKIPVETSAQEQWENWERFQKTGLHRTIRGFDKKNFPVTLFFCLEVAAPTSGGFREIHYKVGFAVCGVEAASSKSLAGDTFTLKLSNLHPWVNRVGIRPFAKDHVFGVEIQRPVDLEFQVRPGLAAKLGSDIRTSHDLSKYSAAEDTWLSLIFSERIQLMEVKQEYVYKIRQLLSLLTGERISLEGISYSETENGVKSEERVVLFDSNGWAPGRPRKFHELRSTFDKLNGQFGQILNKWLLMHEKPDMEQVLALYSSLTNHDFHISAEFIFLAQALEAYHPACGRFEETLELKKDFCERKTRILERLLPDDALWLKGRDSWRNSKSFRDRLRDILHDAPDEAKAIIPDFESFITTVVQNRNAYTHRYGTLSHKKRLLEDGNLFHLARQMSHLLELVLLRDIGLQFLGGEVVRAFNDWTVVQLAEVEGAPSS